jgi:hypothetical protein
MNECKKEETLQATELGRCQREGDQSDSSGTRVSATIT